MTIKYQLKDGSVVEAVKDCNCRHHDGPHWLHMNDLDAASEIAEADDLIELSERLSRQGGTRQEIDHYHMRACLHCQKALRRLANKRERLQAAGVVKIIREPKGAVST